MITWLRVWPILFFPPLIFFLLGCLPEFQFMGAVTGGGVFRQWCANTLVLPLFSQDMALSIISWYEQSNLLNELLLHLLLTINLHALCLPLLYGFGVLIIKLSAWSIRLELRQRRRYLR